MIQTLVDYYRLPPDALGGLSVTAAPPTGNPGYFRFGVQNTCYGRSSGGTSPDVAGAANFESLSRVHENTSSIQLPFDFAEIVENLRLERYLGEGSEGLQPWFMSDAVRALYYWMRGSLPFPVRRQLQKAYFRDWKSLRFPAWPVDVSVDSLHRAILKVLLQATGAKRLPFIWFWPDAAPNALILTHDVETEAGRDFTFQLMDLDESYGLKASYQVIPEERYVVSDEYISRIRDRGCEFNVHDLNHDGNLYQTRKEFERRASEINGYARRYNARGFRAGAMYRRQEWYDAFEFSYDMSVPNVAHLEPLRGGCCTVMPYFVGKILELPLTTTQDYSLFHILDDYSVELWKSELAQIYANHGLMSVLTHPDYLIDLRPRKVYESLLENLRDMIARAGIWAALPGEVDRWWRARSQMNLEPRGDGWDIVGPEKERARLAYAALSGDSLIYEFAR